MTDNEKETIKYLVDKFGFQACRDIIKSLLELAIEQELLKVLNEKPIGYWNTESSEINQTSFDRIRNLNYLTKIKKYDKIYSESKYRNIV